MRRVLRFAAAVALLVVLALLVTLSMAALAGAHARLGTSSGLEHATMVPHRAPSPVIPVAQPPGNVPVTIYLVHSPEQAASTTQQLENAVLMAHVKPTPINLALVVTSPEEAAHIVAAAMANPFVVVDLR